MSQKRILLLSVSAGSGHKRAADALLAYAEMPSYGAEARHLDVMDFVSGTFRKVYTDFYDKLVSRAPKLWGYLYQVSHDAESDSTLERFRRGIERLSTKSLLKEIRSFNPDAIICTHFMPAELLSRMLRKKALSCPVWVQVTDFDLHRLWVQKRMTGYFAANDEVAYRMKAQGIADSAIAVTGIPIMPAFARPLDRAACARESGLDPQRTTVLLIGSGAALGTLDAVAERLLGLDSQFQLIVLAGKNPRALAALQALAERYPGRLVPQGFTHQIERFMSCADLVITKPGGLTTSECLAMGLPMIVNSPIPGQEERNADFLLEQGVALKAFDAVTLEYRVRYLLENPAKLADMRDRAMALGRPDAARRVLDRVLGQS